MTVSDQIIQVLDALCEKFGLVIDWTNENVVPYMTTLGTKLISYEIWTSVAWMTIMLVLTIASIIATKMLVPVFKKGLANQKSYEIGWEVGSTLSILGLSVFYIIVVCVLGTQSMDIIKCVTFPEMHIFEYVQRVLNSGS